MKRAAILCRVSTGSQDTIRQIEELSKFGVGLGYTIDQDDIYEDVISGYSKMKTRPALSQLMEKIEAGEKKYDLVLAWEVQRISRDPIEGQKVLIFFAEHATPIYIKSMDQYTHFEGQYDHKGRLKRNPLFSTLFSIMSEWANEEGNSIQSRSVSGMRSKVKKGHAGGGVFLPTGYTRDADKMLVVDEEEAKIVVEIFQMVLRGYGNKQIVSYLNTIGAPVKSQKVVKKGTIVTRGSGQLKIVKSVKHIRWEEGTVQRILTNPIYKGERRWKLDEVIVNGEKKSVYGNVPAPIIIEPEIFDKVQIIRKERFNSRCITTRYLYLLKGLLSCGVCGRAYTGKYRIGGTDAFYHCSSNRIKGGKCGSVGCNIEALESCIWDTIRFSNQVINYIKSTSNKEDHLKSSIAKLINENDLISKELTACQLELERLKTMYRKGIIGEEELMSEHEKLKKMMSSREVIQSKNNRLIKLSTDQLDVLKKVENYYSVIEQVEKDRVQIMEVVKRIVQNVIITSVAKHHNNYEYIVSVFIRGIEPPLNILIKTKQRNRRSENGFILKDVGDKSKQSRFKYLNAGFFEVNYDQSGRLIEDITKLREKIVEDATIPTAAFESLKFQQLNSSGLLFYTNGEPIDLEGEWDFPLILETIPRLLAFEEINTSNVECVTNQGVLVKKAS